MEENKGRPGWTEYFLEIARAVGRRSTCLRRMYGAIIVKDKIIISTGYNGAPRGEANCIDTGICERERLHVPKGQNYELCVAVHAEQNAIINADPEKMKGAARASRHDYVFYLGYFCLHFGRNKGLIVKLKHFFIYRFRINME